MYKVTYLTELYVSNNIVRGHEPFTFAARLGTAQAQALERFLTRSHHRIRKTARPFDVGALQSEPSRGRGYVTK